MKRNLLAAALALGLLLTIAGCSHNAGPSSGASAASANDHDAVIAAIQQHLASDSGVNMSAMDMTVNSVNVNGDQAQADAEFHLKNGGQSMRISYQLQRQAGNWTVLSDTPSGGGQFSHPPMDKNHSGAAASPNSAEPLPDVADYLKNHAPPPKQ